MLQGLSQSRILMWTKSHLVAKARIVMNIRERISREEQIIAKSCVQSRNCLHTTERRLLVGGHGQEIQKDKSRPYHRVGDNMYSLYTWCRNKGRPSITVEIEICWECSKLTHLKSSVEMRLGMQVAHNFSQSGRPIPTLRFGEKHERKPCRFCVEASTPGHISVRVFSRKLCWLPS